MLKTYKNPAIDMVKKSIISLPTPMNISSWWNYGSLLSMFLVVQLMTGIFLSMHYSNTADLAFSSVTELGRNTNYGWLLRSVHANGASMFFICMYIHIGRGLYYSSFNHYHTWMVGVTILFVTMATSFLGYVLPWGQMSFWGATVITNLLSTIPMIGGDLVYWLWGGFSVNSPTLTRFFSFHFILPFIILVLFMLHIIYLHKSGSSNPLGLNINQIKMAFHPYYTIKDLMGVTIMISLFSIIVFFFPFLLSDPENFTTANPCSTPPHIQPEWYFLFPYAILRSIPNKLGGVLALFTSIALLYVLPMAPKKKYQSMAYYPLNQTLFWGFLSVLILLTWIGSQPVQIPFTEAGMLLTKLYFLYFLSDVLLFKTWEMFLKNKQNK